MSSRRDPRVWRMVTGGAAVLAALAARSAIKNGWRMVRKSDPPLDPESPEVTWMDALVFTALTGALVGVARLLAVRGATTSLHRLLDAEPRGKT